MASLMSTSGGWFDQFEQLRREMDNLLESSFGPASIRAPARSAFPPVNVGIGPESVDVYVFAPGMAADKIDVSVDDHVLTVSGERPREQTEGRTHLRERYSGTFSRAITLPEEIDPERTTAEYRDGVLHVSFARRQESRVRRIEIK